MHKKTIIISVVLLLVLLAGSLGYLTFGKIQYRRQAELKRQTLPTLSVWTTDSSLVQYTPPQPDQPTVVVYFNSECHLCQYEAQAISEDSTTLTHTNVLMLSSEPLPAIRDFVHQYNLDQLEHVGVFGIDPVSVTQKLGTVSVPSILIYDTRRRLVKHYRGETSMEAIAQHL